MQPTATTNKGEAATAYVRVMQATLAMESLTLTALVVATTGTQGEGVDSYCISYGYHRYKRRRGSHFVQQVNLLPN